MQAIFSVFEMVFVDGLDCSMFGMCSKIKDYNPSIITSS